MKYLKLTRQITSFCGQCDRQALSIFIHFLELDYRDINEKIVFPEICHEELFIEQKNIY